MSRSILNLEPDSKSLTILVGKIPDPLLDFQLDTDVVLAPRAGVQIRPNVALIKRGLVRVGNYTRLGVEDKLEFTCFELIISTTL